VQACADAANLLKLTGNDAGRQWVAGNDQELDERGMAKRAWVFNKWWLNKYKWGYIV